MANMQEAYEKVKAPQAGTMTAVSSVKPNGGATGNAWQDAYNAYANGARGQAVAGVYDAQTQAELGGLKAAYDQNLSTQQAAREKIGGAYQQSGNAMQAQYERNRRNLNQQAAANGINTGAGSQQQLALQNVWNRDYGNLMGQQAQAYADADRAIADLQVTYQNAIQQAQAQGDYRKMAALLDDYQQAYNQQLQQAQVLASYGDFSGYNGIYSADQIANMRNAWIASNPQMAYNMGLISAEELARMTGGVAGGSSSRGSYSYSYTPIGSTPPAGDTPATPPNTSYPSYNQGTVSPAGQQLINNARQLGSTPAEISQAAIEAAERGLIPQSEVNTVIAQANQANIQGNGARNQAAGLIAAGAAWSPSIYQQTGISQVEWARMLDAAHSSSSGSSASNNSSSSSSASSTWSNNTSARGAAAHANDEEYERRRRAAASAPGANAAGVSGVASAAPVNPLLAAAQLYF